MAASIPDQWAEQARYDFETAQAMLASRRYLYVLFCCQQAVEKMIKSVIVKQTDGFPPRLHNLPMLAEKAGLSLDDARADFLGLLSSYYTQSRYPEEIEALGRRATPEIASETLEQTEQVLEWLGSMIR